MEASGIQGLKQESYDVEAFRDGNELRIYIRTVAYLSQEALEAAEEVRRHAMINGDGEYCVSYQAIRDRASGNQSGLSKGPSAQEESNRTLNLAIDEIVRRQTQAPQGLPKVPGVVLDKFAGRSWSDKGNPKVTETG